MTLSMELTEKVERIRGLTALDAAEELVRLPADDIQFILSRLPASQAATIASYLGEVAAPDNAASLAVLSGFRVRSCPVRQSTTCVSLGDLYYTPGSPTTEKS